jgi:hypothetical protein
VAGVVATSRTGLSVPEVELRASPQVAVMQASRMNSGFAPSLPEI